MHIAKGRSQQKTILYRFYKSYNADNADLNIYTRMGWRKLPFEDVFSDQASGSQIYNESYESYES